MSLVASLPGNLIPNSGFEFPYVENSGIGTGYGVTHGNVQRERSAQNASSGNMCLRMRPNATDEGLVIWLYGIPPGKYLLGVDLRASTPTPQAYKLSFQPNLTAPVVVSTGNINNNSLPSPVWETICAPVTVASSDYLVMLTGTIAQDYFIDQFFLRPLLSEFQTDAYDQMAPVADQDAAKGYALRNFLGAGAAMFDQVELYARDRGGVPGWGHIYNPMTCPEEALQWLAQISGTVITQGMPLDDIRTSIRDAAGRDRGTRRAIAKNVRQKAILDAAGSSKRVLLQERIGDANHFAAGVQKDQVSESEWSWPLWIQEVLPFASNFVGNSTIETNTSGWLGESGVSTISRIINTSFAGTASLRVVTTNLGGASYSFGTLPAGLYKFFIAYRGETGREYLYAGVEHNGVQTFSGGILGSKNWKVAFGTFTSNGVNSSLIFVRNQAIDGAPSAAKFYLDNAAVFLSSGAAFPVVTDYTEAVFDAVEEQRAVGFFQSRPFFFDSTWTYSILGAVYSSSVSGDGSEESISSYYGLLAVFASYIALENNVRLPETVGNPSFELNTNGWSTNIGSLNAGATLTNPVDVTAIDGTKVGHVVTTAASGAQGIAFSLDNLVVGQTYNFSCWLRKNSGSGNVLIGLFDGVNPIAQVNGAGTSPAAFTNYTYSFTPVVSGTHYILFRTTLSAVVSFDVDKVSLPPAP